MDSNIKPSDVAFLQRFLADPDRREFARRMIEAAEDRGSEADRLARWARVLGCNYPHWTKPPGKTWRPRFVRLTMWQRLHAWWLGLI